MDYIGDEGDELSFYAGDTINCVMKTNDPEWAQGECNGQSGFFPTSHTRIQASNKAAWAINPDVSGWILKANPTGLIKKYRKRYFAVVGSVAYYYQTPQVRCGWGCCEARLALVLPLLESNVALVDWLVQNYTPIFTLSPPPPSPGDALQDAAPAGEIVLSNYTCFSNPKKDRGMLLQMPNSRSVGSEELVCGMPLAGTVHRYPARDFVSSSVFTVSLPLCTVRLVGPMPWRPRPSPITYADEYLLVSFL